jgi:predicted GIY-YIG superfamily endonuclease
MYNIYRIYCKDENITDCYIGRTNNLKRRIIDHKKISNPNLYLYQFITENNGFNNFIFECLEECKNLTIAKEKERYWYEIYKPTLNIQYPNRQPLEASRAYKEKNKDKIKEATEKKSESILCECGGKYSYWGKNRHYNSQKHIKYLEKI